MTKEEMIHRFIVLFVDGADHKGASKLLSDMFDLIENRAKNDMLEEMISKSTTVE